MTDDSDFLPITLVCGHCGDGIDDVVGPGGAEYCDAECQRAARRKAMAVWGSF